MMGNLRPVRHARGAFALDAAFTAEGPVTALFGRSGSGKSTLVDGIAGLVRPDHGRVVVDGFTLLELAKKHYREIGRDPDDLTALCR